MAEALQNRWHHRPKLHRPGDGHELKVGWLELFYDLIYVAAIIQLGNALSQNVGILGFLSFFGVMAPLWFAWTSFTFFSNRFVIDDVIHRMMVFTQMMCIGAVAVCVPGVFGGEPQAFAIAYAGVRVIMALFYVRTWVQCPDARDLTFRYASGFSIGAVIWVAAAFINPPYCFFLWAVALGIDFITTTAGRSHDLNMKAYPPDVHHMTERFGLLTIIVLGESFVKVLTALSEHGLTSELAGMGIIALAVTCFVWWLYFDDVGGSRIKATPWSATIWIYAHLPFTVAIVGVGVAVKKAVFFVPSELAPEKYRWLLCGTLALALLCAALLDQVTERRQAEVGDGARVAIRFGAALFVLLLVPIGSGMPAWIFLATLAGVCVLQVAFDLATAPLAADPHSVHDPVVSFDPTSVEDDPDEGRFVVKNRRGRAMAIVRKGTPSELRSDLYFHLMEGSWPQLLGMMTIAYLLSNAMFAGLFMISPGGITGLGPNDFWGAFAFSVQTMSTIGYGSMSPQSGVADFLVTIEAAVGLLGVAVVTGVIFAKIARPTSSVLFSRPIVITTDDGPHTLMFRVGNARGNEIVEARMNVSIMCEEHTSAGRFNRLYDLKLVRQTSPIFTMSWSVMHTIDESSPLWGLSEAEVRERISLLIVTMTGYDSTYAQTTHARNIYTSSAIRYGHRFVDVVQSLPDGRMMIDYDKFHLTEPHVDEAGEEE